jgi:prepilin-type processing-associated H-X9-DG protein
MNAVGIAVLFCAMQVTVFVALAAALNLITFRRDPAMASRMALAGMVGVAMLTVVCWSPWPNWASIAERARTVTQTVSSADAPTSAANVGNERESAPIARPHSVTDSSTTVGALWEGLRQVWSGEILPERTTRRSWSATVAVAFILAAAVGLVRLVVGLEGVARLRRRGAPITDPRLTELVDVLRAELDCGPKVTLLECESLGTAATVGWRRPIVLLPRTWRAWTADELRVVLAHEISHVSRGDFAAQLVSQVGLALHSYHPLVHWLAGRLRLEQELAADAAAARIAGGRQSYLNTLVGLALAQPAARLAWPAQAFIPSRHMFLRRIEMLRGQSSAVYRSAGSSVRRRIAGWLSIAALCGAGLVVVGLRAPAVVRAEDRVAEKNAANKSAATANNNDKVKYDFSYVPKNTTALFAVRQAELAADPRLQPLADILEQNTRPALPSKLVEQAMLLLVAPDLDDKGHVRIGSGGEQIVIHTAEQVDFAAYLKKGYEQLTTVQDGGHELMVIGPHPSTMSFFMPDKQTLLGRSRTGLLELLKQANAAKPPASADAWNAAANGPVLLVATSGPAGEMLKGRTDAIAVMVMPLLHDADTLMLWIEPKENLRIVGRISCKSPEAAKRVSETLGALAALGRNAAQMQENQALTAQGEAANLRPFWSLIGSGLQDRKVTTSGSDVHLEIPLGNTADAVKLTIETLTPALKAARDAAKRTVSQNNLKQIAIAMHQYADQKKHFPAPVLMGPDGKTPYSWRVALLPYLGHDALYKQYHFDQPWDSPDNRKVLEQMPSVYRHPMDESSSLNTSYFVLTGPDTAFADGDGVSLKAITDGTSKTLMAVEAKRNTPWSKPEDIPYTANGPLPKLGGWSERGSNIAMCDGSVRFIANEIDEKFLRAMISKAGGE